jgi:hypothetical protein
MSGEGGAEELRATVEVDYGQWYLFDRETMLEDIGGLVGDAVEQAELWERKCATSGGAAIIYANKHDGPTNVVIRSMASVPERDDIADHLVECSVTNTSGRLAISGWESSVVVGELAVPAGPLRLRIAWYGLTAADDVEDWDRERFEVTVFEAPLTPVEVLRWWPGWVPPSPESETATGLRRYAGKQAAKARSAMEPLMRSFSYPYPEHEGVVVTSLWRDPADGSHWAHGTGDGSQVLVELSDDAFTRLQVESYEPISTYARDAEGRLWFANQQPIERAIALLFISSTSWRHLQEILPAGSYRLVELPNGWSRITRRPLQPPGKAELVESVENDGADGYYQRWPDGADIPW